MPLAASGAPVVVKRRAVELVKKVKMLAVYCNGDVMEKSC
jgi:hypothetical protein